MHALKVQAKTMKDNTKDVSSYSTVSSPTISMPPSTFPFQDFGGSSFTSMLDGSQSSLNGKSMAFNGGAAQSQTFKRKIQSGNASGKKSQRTESKDDVVELCFIVPTNVGSEDIFDADPDTKVAHTLSKKQPFHSRQRRRRRVHAH